MSYVIYNPETKSIEDAGGCILIDVPDWEADSPEAMESWLEDYWHMGRSIGKLIMFMDDWASGS